MATLSRAAAGVVLAALLVAACADGSGQRETMAAVAADEAQADGGAWRTFATMAEEVEGFDTLAEMGKIADAVLIAQATGVDGVRRVGPGGDGGIDLVQIRFAVIRAIGDWHEDSVVLELDRPAAAMIAALEEQVPGLPPTLVAVRDKGGEEAGSHRLVNSLSLWTEQPDGGLVAPLAEDPSGRELASELADLESLEDLGDHLEAARRDCDPECGLAQAAWNR